MVSHLGCTHGRSFLCSCCLPRTEGRTGLRSCYSHCDYRRWRVCRCQALECPTRKRHHPVHWCLFWCRCCWCYLHLTRHLYPAGEVSGDERRLLEDFYCLATRWCLGHLVPHSLPSLLRGSATGTIPLPRGHSHHAGAKERRYRR